MPKLVSSFLLESGKAIPIYYHVGICLMQRAEDETARLYAEFVESFQGDTTGSKTFVRGGTINPNDRFKDDSEG